MDDDRDFFKGEIVLLTGAGASAPLEMHTMEDVICELRKKAKTTTEKEQLLEYIIDTLTTLKEEEDQNTPEEEKICSPEDLEEIYFCLKSLKTADKMLKLHSRKKNPNGKVSQTSKSTNFIKLLEKREELIADCETVVFECWGKIIEKNRVTSLYKPLFSLLHSHLTTKTLCIFTTNYDRSFEIYKTKAKIQLTDGFLPEEPGENPFWKIENYDVKKTPDSLVLFKLHGSCDWVWGHNNQLQRNPNINPSKDKSKDAIVFPSKDKLPINEPFFSSYEYFGRCLEQASFLIVIGYSFRDFGIVAKIKGAARWNKKLQIILIDPLKNKTSEIVAQYQRELSKKLGCAVIIIRSNFMPVEGDDDYYLHYH